MEWGRAASAGNRMEDVLAGRVRGIELLGGVDNPRRLAEKVLGDESLAGLIGEIQAEADRMLGEEEAPLTDELFRGFRETGERLPYERVYFAKRKRLNAFALMTWLRGEEAGYAEALRATVESFCDEWTWCLPAHYGEARGPHGNIDLFAAETGFALSEISVLLGEVLGPRLTARIKEETERRVFEPFLATGPFPWETLHNNWAAVCAGSIGAAALYVMDDEERLGKVLERVHAAMDCFLAGFGEDGACLEGYSYWQYGVGYYVYYIDLLKTATRGVLDGFAGAKVNAIALFQQRCFSSGDTVINFSDSPQRSGVYMGLTMRLRREYPDVALPHSSLREPYAADHCGRWAHALRNLIWAAAEDGEGGRLVALEAEGLTDESRYAADAEAGEGDRQVAAEIGGLTDESRYTADAADGDGGRTDSAALEDWPAESRYLADAEWFLARHVPEAGASYCFAAKGGNNGEPHNHNDGGHFILHANGEAYLADLGRGMYTKQYFGRERYSFWCNGSQGHSVPIVNGQLQEEGADRKAIVIEASVGEQEDLYALELGGLYPAAAGVTSIRRTFRWSKSAAPVLTICDAFVLDTAGGGRATVEGAAAAGASITERFISMLEPEFAGGELIIRGRYALRIGYDSGIWEPVITKRSDFDHFGQERFWYTIDFQFEEGIRGDGIEAVFTFEFMS